VSVSDNKQGPVVTVPLRIHSSLAVAAGCQPISVGVPFPKGAIREGWFATLAEGGESPMPLQAAILAQWNDGSVRWLLIDFLAPQLRKGANELALAVSPTSGTVPIPVARGVPDLDVELSSEEWNCLYGVGIEVTDRYGRARGLYVENVDVESHGPVRTTLRSTGRIPGFGGLRFSIRLCSFADTGLLRLRVTIHNSRRARHRGGLWDLGDPGSVLFRDLSLRVPLDSEGLLSWKVELGESTRHVPNNILEIHQNSSGGENWQSRNHVNRLGRVPCRFQGYRVRAGEVESCGRRAEPVLWLHGEQASVAVSVPEFWQQFPKTIEANTRSIRVGLFPAEWGDLFELQGGERKTHVIWLRFGPGAEDGDDCVLDWTHQPAVALPTPEWSATAGALPDLLPAGCDSDGKLVNMMDEALAGDRGLFAKREMIDEYGWRNFGDVWADHEDVHYDGPKPVISHYNNQFDFLDGAITQMLRTGNPRWFAILDPLARHLMDIDIYHARRDRAVYSGGMFWMTDHYLDAATSTHRTYTRANVPKDGRPYGGGPGSEHNYATGLLHYYYLTGDSDARDAVFGLANWVLRNDDGAENIFGIIDDGPTGAATLWGHSRGAGPGRGGANSISTLLDAFELAQDEKYLRKAEELIRRCVHPREDVSSRELLDAEMHWSYTMFLSAVARYLDIQAERGAIGEDYAYAQASLVHYARWMVDHERPYLDRADDLRYPTETWAAQEFRKANVLRRAARHVDVDEARAMRSRGDELADRAWADLMSFRDTYLTSRPLAIVMREGAWDAVFRVAPWRQMPLGVEVPDFGPFAEFENQRTRVLRQLRTVRGFCRAVAGLFGPSTWRRAMRLARRRWGG
jgi:hypothetical protein